MRSATLKWCLWIFFSGCQHSSYRYIKKEHPKPSHSLFSQLLNDIPDHRQQNRNLASLYIKKGALMSYDSMISDHSWKKSVIETQMTIGVSRCRWLLWMLLVLQSPSDSTAHAVMAAIISPRRGGSRIHQRQRRLATTERFRSCSTVTPFVGTKLRHDASSNNHPSRTTAFVESLKKPLFSWLKRIGRTPGDAGLSAATQDQKDFTSMPNLITPKDLASNRGDESGLLPQESVHLQLTQQGSDPPDPPSETKKKVTIVQELAFTDPTTNVTWKALNTCRRKFIAYLEYQGIEPKFIDASRISASKIEISQEENGEKRMHWRELWKAQRLLTDRTEFLAVYQSDQPVETLQNENQCDPQYSAPKRRGGFADLLHLYTERLVGILQDEDEDTGEGVLGWLKEHYGRENTRQITLRHFKTLTEQEQIDHLQKFAEWFRGVMPYYYDRCGSCSASFKDESAVESQEEKENVQRKDADEDDNDDKGTFLGYIYPSENELKGKASRTELYQCHKCNAFTRFPRFNSAHAIINSKRGRCGEYSTLIYRFFRSLGLETRWVVDWADHVWAEVRLEGPHQRWVHLDPCEAAVDRPHLYQEWGKKQIFIVALYAPQASVDSNGESLKLAAPLIQDVTTEYTTESLEAIIQRRDESSVEVNLAISNAIGDLEEKFGIKK